MIYSERKREGVSGVQPEPDVWNINDERNGPCEKGPKTRTD